MRNTIVGLIVCLCLTSPGRPIGQSGFDGRWITTDFNNNPIPLVFTIQGSAVLGTVGAANQPRPIRNGQIQGDTIIFTASNNATAERVVTFTGKISGNEIRFTRNVVPRDPSFNTGNGIFGALGPMEFVAKRDTTPGLTLTVPRSTGPISTNDNRIAAGTMTGQALTVRLEARAGEWHPDRDTDPAILVNAFAVEGEPMQIPGPLIRAVEGTEVRASIRNNLNGAPLEMHGLYSRSGPTSSAETVSIPFGETHEFRFLAGKPGTYYYWGTTDAGVGLDRRSAMDSQLSGAFVVEPRGAPSAPADRVLVIGLWTPSIAFRPFNAFRIVINGRSWPNTERLSYPVGDTVRMRVINAGTAVHPMHLHGFYFNVDSRGDEQNDVVYGPGASANLVVTERLEPGRTFSLTWKPTRPGNWLFHCHDNEHLLFGGPVDGSPLPAASHHVENHALEMMAGPVMGITVTGASAEPGESASALRRELRLVARVDTGGTDSEPAYGYSLEDPKAGGSPPKPPYLPGPTLILERGQPVSITVENQLPEPTSVHWHGIELDSYFDGVAGFSGQDGRISPAIQPGGSFEARFTPPRSGTFIYHTHIDEVRQQLAGLSGPLLVVDSVASYDAAHNVVVMVTAPRKLADARGVLINGSPTPPPPVLTVGERYRFRFIDIHVNRTSMRMRLLRDSTLLTWRGVAKDGRDLPADRAVSGPSEIQMGNGETYDFEFVPGEAGDLRLDVTEGRDGLLLSMPIKVR